MLVCTQHALQKHVTVTLSVLAIGCGSKTELEVQAGSAALLVCYWIHYFGGLLVHKLSYWRRIISLLVDSAGLLVCTGLLVLLHWIISLLDY